MNLITAPSNLLMSIVWSRPSLSDGLQTVKENHPSNLVKGLAIRIQKSVMELSSSAIILATMQ
jgi:hypothetical protein